MPGFCVNIFKNLAPGNVRSPELVLTEPRVTLGNSRSTIIELTFE
jgi:hypothetical protein